MYQLMLTREDRNPWLDIPLDDYERHMEMASVQQAQMLRSELHRAVRRYGPQSLAILGSAGGNGLEVLDGATPESVIAIDINPEYLAACRSRYQTPSRQLRTIQWDLSIARPPMRPVDLVFVALVLEYLNLDAFLTYAPSLVAEGGHLIILSQNSDASGSPITPSGIPSLNSLESIHRTVDDGKVIGTLTEPGRLLLESRSAITSGTGKMFTMWTLCKPSR